MTNKRIYDLTEDTTPAADDFIATDKSGEAAASKVNLNKLMLADGTTTGSASQAQSFGATGIKADVIAESTGAAGVTVDGVLLKDGDATIDQLLGFAKLGTNVLFVDPDGSGAYTTLSGALAAISDAAADNRYAIYVRGDIAETSQIEGKSHVDVIGIGGASVTVTKTTSNPGVVLDSVENTLWRDLKIVHTGEIANGETYVYAFSIQGTSDRTVVCENVVAQNLCTAAGTANHFAAFVIEGTATPTLRHCEGIGSATAYYGHGMWWDDSAGGIAIDCIGRAGSNGSAQYNWGMYIKGSATPMLINYVAYGSNLANYGYGMQVRGAASPTLVSGIVRGGDGGDSCHGLILDDACTPKILGGDFRAGIGGASSYAMIVYNYAAPEIDGAAFLPRQFTGGQTVTETTTFVANADVAHQIKAISWQVDVAGTGGATLAVGTTLGGGEIVAATAITSTGTKYPILIGVGAEEQLAAGATIYVTVTGTGSPSVQMWWGGEYALPSHYAVSLQGYGAVRINRCTIVGNCYSSYGIVIGAAARTANVLRITNSHIEARRKSSGSGAAAYTSAAYDPAPIYNCTFVGAATNITGAAGTANGTNVILA